MTTRKPKRKQKVGTDVVAASAPTPVEAPKEPCEYGCDEDGHRYVLHRKNNELHKTRCICRYTDLPYKLVLQKEHSGCMLAAVATITGRTYDEVRQYCTLEHDWSKDGTWTSVTDDLFAHFGYAVQEYSSYCPRLEAPRPEWPLKPWAPVHLCQVTNLTETGQHAVVLLPDGRVLDPWWGVVQGLHRYKRVVTITGVWKVSDPQPNAVTPC